LAGHIPPGCSRTPATVSFMSRKRITQLCHHDIHPRARRQQRRSPLQKGRAWTGTGTLRMHAIIPCNTRFPILRTRRSKNRSCPGIMRPTPTRMKMTWVLTRISRARSRRQNGSPGRGRRKNRGEGGLDPGGTGTILFLIGGKERVPLPVIPLNGIDNFL